MEEGGPDQELQSEPVSCALLIRGEMTAHRIAEYGRHLAIFTAGAFALCLLPGWAPEGLSQTNRMSSFDPKAAPSIVISEAIHDFGEADEGTRVAHEFMVENTGGGELTINKVSPD
jgi:hypothetical protein